MKGYRCMKNEGGFGNKWTILIVELLLRLKISIFTEDEAGVHASIPDSDRWKEVLVFVEQKIKILTLFGLHQLIRLINLLN